MDLKQDDPKNEMFKEEEFVSFEMSHVMRKPVYAICEQQRAQISLRIRAVWSAPLLFAA